MGATARPELQSTPTARPYAPSHPPPPPGPPVHLRQAGRLGGRVKVWVWVGVGGCGGRGGEGGAALRRTVPAGWATRSGRKLARQAGQSQGDKAEPPRALCVCLSGPPPAQTLGTQPALRHSSGLCAWARRPPGKSPASQPRPPPPAAVPGGNRAMAVSAKLGWGVGARLDGEVPGPRSLPGEPEPAGARQTECVKIEEWVGWGHPAAGHPAAPAHRPRCARRTSWRASIS
jgi:hypothetical protein